MTIYTIMTGFPELMGGYGGLTRAMLMRQKVLDEAGADVARINIALGAVLNFKNEQKLVAKLDDGYKGKVIHIQEWQEQEQLEFQDNDHRLRSFLDAHLKAGDILMVDYFQYLKFLVVDYKRDDIVKMVQVHNMSGWNPDMDDGDMSWVYREYLLNHEERYDKLVVANTTDRDTLVENYHISPEKIELIHWPIVKRKTHIVPDNTLAFVSRLATDYKISWFIPVIQAIKCKVPNFKLNVYGAGEEEEKLKCQVIDLGLMDNVIFHGYTKNPIESLSGNRISIQLSLGDANKNLVTQEALQNDVPVVVFKGTDNQSSDFVENDVNGYEVDLGDFETFAERVKLLLTDENVYQRIKQGAINTRLQNNEKFVSDWARMASIKKIAVIKIDISEANIRLILDEPITNSNKLFLSTKVTGKRTYWTEIQRLYPQISGNQLIFDLNEIVLRKTSELQLRGGASNITVIATHPNIISKSPLVIKIPKSKPALGKVVRTGELTYDRDGNLPIIARKRIDIRYLTTDKASSYAIKTTDDHKFKINLNEMITSLNLVDRDYVDFYEVDAEGIEHLLSVETFTSEYSVKNSVNFIETANNEKLGMRFASTSRLYIKHWELKEESLYLTLNKTPEFDLIKLYLNEVNADFEDDVEGKSLDFALTHTTLVLKNFKQNLEVIAKQSIKYQFCLRFKVANDQIIGTFKFTGNLSQIVTDRVKLTAQKNHLDDFIFNLNSYKRDNTIKVAIHGSSFTRGVFVSSDYFNPDYKNYFDVVFTQHHGSIRAMANDVRHTWLPEYFIAKDLKPLRQSIRRDIEKTFFDDLKEANADFLVVDLYSDIRMGVIELRDGCILTYNTSQVESDYLAEVIDQKMIISGMTNDSEYRQKFKEALRIYRERILEIFDEKRVVLHCNELNYVYMGIDGKTHPYQHPTADEITMINHFATQLQKDFIEIFPNASVIDSRRLSYIGDETMPTGNIPEHYQPERYTWFLNEFGKLVAQRLKEENDEVDT